MKNTFLKKAGAVALAAVMAVTFAPVASLNVFAGGITKDAASKVDASGSDTDIDDPTVTSYVIATKGGVEVTTKGSFTIDIAGNDLGVTIPNTVTQATITVKNTKAVAGHQTTIPKVSIDAKTTTAIKVKLQGNFALVVSAGAAAIDFGSTPVADINGQEYVGQGAITAAYNDVPEAKADIVARNGSVKVSGLLSGHYAKVASNAAIGTKITATAYEGVTLQTWTTTFRFDYASSYDKQVGRKGSERDGSGTYTDVRYYAGDKSADFGKSKDAALNEKSDILSDAGVGYATIKDSLAADELKLTNTDGETSINYTLADDIKKTKNYSIDSTVDNTYYAFDPKSYVDEGRATANIDETKYRVVDKDEDLLSSSIEPSKSINITQTAEYTTDDKDKTAVFTLSYHNPKVTITAPDDLTVLTGVTTNVSGKTTSYEVKAGFFGTSKFGDSAVKAFDKGNKITGTKKAIDYNVLQIAKGADSTFTVQDRDNDATISHAEGIGYYRTSANDYDYTFGTTAVVTKEFEDNAQGVVKNGLLANPAFRDGTVFASKEIKTTVKGVNADVTMLGEISAEATATAADGSKTWEINLADTATNDKAVVAYRLYDGNRGEHIYTYNAKERDMLVAAGWKEETSDIKVLPVDAKTGVTVYRVYNPNNGGAHVFTTNPAEVKMLLDAGWEEGVAVFKTPAAGTANTLPVYRVYNTGSKNGEHQFTTSAAERDNLVNHGWKLEGTPWYSFK